MSALLEMLKKAGAKPEDLEAMRTLLENPEYNAAYSNELKARDDARVEAEKKAREFEAKSNEFQAKTTEFQTKAEAEAKKSEEMLKWYNETATPAYQTAMNDAIRARENAAQLEARLKAAEEYGFNVPKIDPPTVVPPVVATPPAAVVPPVSEKVDLPDLSKYSTKEELNSYYSQAGDAIAMAQDIAFEHQQLFGFEKPLSFHDLRQKAMTEKQPLRSIWEREFNVAGRKQEIETANQQKIAAARQAEIDAARKEAREQALSEIGNPMTRDPQASRHPALAFSTRDRAGKQPWDATGPVDRSTERASKVLTTLAKQNVA